jgi:hypothetical protein
MRIVIEIDGDEVTAKTGYPRAEATEPPPELRRAAAELGAVSAGAAPTEPGAPARLEDLPRAALDALAAGAADAGSAPAAPDDAALEPAKPARRSSTRSRSTTRRRAKS